MMENQDRRNLPLLTTKLYIPPPRPNMVTRPRLIERLDEGLARGHRLSLISAPAGFGKTTLVTEWVCCLVREIAWLSLDEGDNDPVQFLTYLVAALQQVDGRIGRTVRQILGGPQLPPLSSLATALINDVSAADVPLALVLDDYQLITSPAVHDLVGLFLGHQLPPMHLVISTRQDPPLPLHRLRARGQVTEIHDRDLRFTGDEAADFLEKTMGLRLSGKAVAALEARTEGWVAGLQLAAIALQEDQDHAEGFITSFRGDDRYVVDYLVGEVVHRQPEILQAFLRQTSILDRLTAPLCEAITGREDSGEVLAQLDRANLFLVPLDNRREWYRYHRLFAEVLRTTVSLGEQRQLHRKAARWLEAHGYTGQALRHALAYATLASDTDGGAWDDAVRLVRAAAGETMLRGAVMTARGWLEALPDEQVRADTELASYMGWVLALTGDMPGAEEYAGVAPPGADAPGQEIGKRLALRSFLAVFGHQDYGQASELAAGALQALPGDQVPWRVMALWILAESQERTTYIGEAVATLRQARREGRRLGSPIFAITVELFLATALNHQGRRREAVGVCEESIDWYTDEPGRPSPVSAMLYSRLGTLYHEANELEQARAHLDQGLALAEELALGGSSIYAKSFAAPTLHAMGETEAALAALEEAYQLSLDTGLSDAGWCLALQAGIYLQQGDLAVAVRWAEETGLAPDDEPEYLTMDRYLVYARLLCAQGRLSDARLLLSRLERLVEERGLVRWLISVRILQALVASRAGDGDGATERLALAVSMAAPEGYVRAFLDEGVPVAGLLGQVQVQGDTEAAFVDAVLTAFGPGATKPKQSPVVVPGLVEPLSEREIEVLKLIAAGLTNREIAQELVIAVGTVKRHINNIYGKLGVHSRTQAVALARELGIL